MEVQVRSSAAATERRTAAAVRVFVVACVLTNPTIDCFVAHARPKAKTPRPTSDRFRFQITDSENDLPIPGATVALVYWQRKDSCVEKKEVEIKTDKNGIAEFPRIEAEQIAVSVSVKGFRSCWRWIRANSAEDLT